MSARPLKPSSLLVVFTYAPAGLGHLRVAEALYCGLPKDIPHCLLGSDDQTISTVHRIMSNHPLGHKVMESIQKGTAEDIFTTVYRWILRKDTKKLTYQLQTILNQRIDQPKNILVIATHFGLAHKLAAVKNNIAVKTGKNIFLIVQVTDDSPQHIWYVEGADLIVVPSHYTKNKLLQYAKEANLAIVPIIVLPYPISPEFGCRLSKDDYQKRLREVEPKGKEKVQTVVPISGATVGLPYLVALIENLTKSSTRFFFHVVSKQTAYSEIFLRQIEKNPSVSIKSSLSDREVVDYYKSVYMENIIGLEITKPSEQSFKTLITPQDRGGSILLFTHPVGQQEYDNLNFMTKHKLMPKSNESDIINKLPQNNFISSAINWRALRLPDDPSTASSFIKSCLSQGIFQQMMKYQPSSSQKNCFPDELGDDGVKRFWEEVFSRI